jgi:uncharacterized protein with gpF-like domain
MRPLYKGSRKQEAIIINRLIDTQASRLERKLKRVLDDVWKQASDNPNALDLIIDRNSEALARPLIESMTSTARVFNKRMVDAILTRNTKSAEVPSPTMFENLLTAWLVEYSSTLIRNLERTTKNQIASAIATARENGLGLVEAAEAIMQTASVINPVRASIIARTETHYAANQSSQLTAKAANVEMEKEWVAVTDNRTRSSHVAADGQTRRLTEPFNVGGYRLQTAGDQSAGAPSETIMCRCAVVYNVVD